jgi:hypothetical protein
MVELAGRDVRLPETGLPDNRMIEVDIAQVLPSGWRPAVDPARLFCSRQVFQERTPPVEDEQLVGVGVQTD